jgi:hypothetical protein
MLKGVQHGRDPVVEGDRWAICWQRVSMNWLELMAWQGSG